MFQTYTLQKVGGIKWKYLHCPQQTATQAFRFRACSASLRTVQASKAALHEVAIMQLFPALPINQYVKKFDKSSCIFI